MLIKDEMNSTIPPIYFPESTLPLSSGTGKVPIARSLGPYETTTATAKRTNKKRQLCTPFCTFLCRPCNNYDVK